MRIAQISATFPPYWAGTGNVCFHYAMLLASLGHEVTVYTAKTNGNPNLSEYGFIVKQLASLIRIGNAPLLPGLLFLPRFDLVHLHYPFITGAEIVLFNHLLRGQPYIITYHNDLTSSGVKGLLFLIYQKLWTRIILNRAKKIIVPSWDFAQSSNYLKSYTQESKSHLVEIPNGVDTEIFKPGIDAHQIREKHNIKRSSQSVVMFVGAMDSAHHYKGGVVHLLEAFARLNGPDVTLVLVGGGDRKSSYEDYSTNLGLHNQVVFTDWVPHNLISQYLSIADIVVLPSLYTESFGMVAIEAMACAKPVIASRLPGLRTVVDDGASGFLYHPGDEIELCEKLLILLNNPEQRIRFGRAGRAKVESKYSWTVIANELEKVYVS